MNHFNVLLLRFIHSFIQNSFIEKSNCETKFTARRRKREKDAGFFVFFL